MPDVHKFLLFLFLFQALDHLFLYILIGIPYFYLPKLFIFIFFFTSLYSERQRVLFKN